MKTARSAFCAARILALLASLLPSLATAAWIAVADMPTGVSDSHYASVGGKFYAAGGSISYGIPVSALQIYDPAANSWTQGAAMPNSRSDGTMQAIGTKLYLVGGWRGGPNSSLMIYDTTSNAWSNGADFPTLSGCGQSGVLSGQMYVLNARYDYSGSDYVHDFYSYNPSTDAWTARARPSYDHAYGAAGVIGGKLYVAGGYDDGLQTHTRLEIYDPTTNTWSAGPAMPGKRSGAGAAVLNGVLYVIGGRDGSTYLTSTVAYDPVAGSWATLPDLLPTGTFSSGAMGSGNQLYVFGGYPELGLQAREGYSLAVSAGSAGPSATISTNQTSFTENSNEILALSATIRAGSAAGTAADIYVQADVAGLGVFYLGPPPGWIWSAAVAPVVSLARLADIDAPNFYSIPIAGLPATTYTFDVFVLRSGYYPYSPTGTLATATSAMTINPRAQPAPSPTAPPCTYSLTPTSQTFSAQGGSSWMTVKQRESTCLVVEWTPRSNAAWITGVYAYGMSNGNGNVAYTVSRNTSPTQRQGTISVAGQTFTVTQSGANPFQGSVVGSWGGHCQFDLIPMSVSGSFSMSIDAAGNVSGTYSGDQSGMIQGSVSTGGNLSAGSASGGISWRGQFALVGGSLRGNGTWTDNAFCSGSWATSP